MNQNKIEALKGLDSSFAKDVFIGLSERPRYLPSKYFYDEVGDKIFQEIMHMDDYYLTRAELSIFYKHKASILNEIGKNRPFRLLELGAGDGYKTQILLEYFVSQNCEFTYSPVDISKSVLDELSQKLADELPQLSVDALAGDYFQMLADISRKSDLRNVVFFLGSNIGNYVEGQAIDFLRKVRAGLRQGDKMLIGFDLKKDPDVILRAYNDEEGVTNRFNLNLLERINNELGADFDLEKYDHRPVYDPMTGECRSYLLSTEEQEVQIPSLNRTFHFAEWEPVFMEVSKKYDESEIKVLAEDCGFKAIQEFYDDKKYFVDVLWEAI
ncbi:MAG: L-histidine N(alpha)-methyltransferase [Cyclobacteriaceae bacterium]